MTDEALRQVVQRAQQGDARAFDLLVRRFQNPAVAYARTLLRDPAAAEDAAQEAFVQAWRDLPRLTNPVAFGGWLRRIVFKFCDRVRRAHHLTLPLSESLVLPEEHLPTMIVERAEVAAQVREAIDALPCALREATLLYYLTGHDTREIAAFLELPLSTVKNRLHAARKQLRKELWTMAETVLEQEKPSQNETFAETVLARVLREFYQQEKTDPHTVDRGLLEEGRTALFEQLATGAPIEVPTARDAFTVLWRKLDWPGLSAVLMRYLAQPLPDSETAWAYLHLANALAISGSAAGAVLAHEAFERWLPGKRPILSSHFPYTPTSRDDARPVLIGQEVRLRFLGQSVEFTSSYAGLWRGDEYLAKVDAALAEIPITPANCRSRFSMLHMASNACEKAGDFNRSRGYVQQMHILAAEAAEERTKTELHAKALQHDVSLARLIHDEAAFLAAVTALSNFLQDQESIRRSGWIYGGRHNLACELVWGQRYDLALPLWEANAATWGQVGGFGWLMYAATVWQLTHDRARTLTLLREAPAHDDRDLIPLFVERPEFADVRDDPEFLQTIRRTPA